jgi:hypothetical protein
VSGELSVVEREKVLERFDALDDDECGIVSNARCLGEGVDVPAIDSICFVDPKRSAIDIVQAVDRAIRKSEKKVGTSTIILPVPIPDTTDPTTTIESSAFETVWRVLEALRAHDDVLVESLNELRTRLGERRGGKIKLPKLTLDLPRSVSAAFSDAIQLRVLERSTESFWEGLDYLKAYKAKKKDCLVEWSFKTEDGFNLGTWVSNRRKEYGKGKLSQDRVDALDKLEFVWDPFEHNFQKGLGYLKAYKAKKGNCLVALRFKTGDGFNLGIWVRGRRQQYNRKNLFQERIAALEQLGFVWSAKES